jgi:hypothetical protein
MKAKGKAIQKLKGIKKEKIKKTLDKMTENREKDTLRIRTVIGIKLKVLEEETLKADDLIKQHEEKILELKYMKLRITGAIIALKEVINNDTNV